MAGNMDAAFSKKLEAFVTEHDTSADVKAFLELLVKNHDQLTTSAKEYRALGNDLNAAASAVNVVGAPDEKILSGYDFLRGASLDFLDGINNIRQYLIIKSPQMKVEDNDGVQVQQHVLEQLSSWADAISALGGKKDDKGINLVSVNSRREYLTARVAAEEKVHKGSCNCGSSCECGKDGKDCGCNKSKETQSSPALLGQLDADAALKIGNSLEQLALVSLSIVTIMARNMSILQKPRRSGMSSMIG